MPKKTVSLLHLILEFCPARSKQCLLLRLQFFLCESRLLELGHLLLSILQGSLDICGLPSTVGSHLDLLLVVFQHVLDLLREGVEAQSLCGKNSKSMHYSRLV